MKRYMQYLIFCGLVCLLSGAIWSLTSSAEQQSAANQESKRDPLVTAESSFAIWPEIIEGLDEKFVSARLVSNRFIFAHLPQGPVILRELIDIEESTSREYGDGRITVEAYEARPGNTTPLWTFSANGRSGDVLFDDYTHKVYRLRQAYCCDLSHREIYYDLANGKELFSTTTPALTIVHEDSAYRYIGYDDGAGSEQPAEMEHDNTILGMLSYAGDGIATRKLAVMGNSENEYRQQVFEVTHNNQPIPIKDNMIQAFEHQIALTDELWLSVNLVCRCEVNEKIMIPILNDRFVIEKAVLSEGITLKELP
ncbi:hypothetical protein U27_06145 [Candidatus Vecturithrix granuli]|uniref:Uncharacterized protein n=1 Tax=Vecturithrix granuli TaxID=1499967 RepID=A0A081C3L4_VECG1|nr:hypothetical protein U27_06145 [Candidatus Vecturithrix granuli]